MASSNASGPTNRNLSKIVSTAKSLADNVVMMHFLERTGDMANMVGLCMGDQGIISRVLAIRAGSVFTFAAATQGEETAPGQIAARTLTDTYRIARSIRPRGSMVSRAIRSSTPSRRLMMNTAFHRETVNAVYLALQTSKLSDLLTVVRELPLSGLSVTMPLKQEVLKHLENMDPSRPR
jgi:3-dehydroquinate dehydratase/shikimate dehydrogenase